MDLGVRSKYGEKHSQRRHGRAAGAAAARPGDGAGDGKEDLPPGWVKVASRSKPGAFFYAHPATKRTQVEKPRAERLGAERPRRHAPASSSGGHRQGAAEAPAPAPQPVVDLDAIQQVDLASAEQRADEEAERKRRAQAEAAARKRQAQAEAEAEEASREEALQKAREKRARAAQAEREDTPEEPQPGATSTADGPTAAAAAATAAAAAAMAAEKARPGGVRAGAGEARGKRRRKAWKKDLGEEGEGVTQEEFDRWREEQGARETSTDVASSPGSDPDVKEDPEFTREFVPDPLPTTEPCLDVLKFGRYVERHTFTGGKMQWMLGRATGQVDIPMQHESISRQHATVIRNGTQLFIADLGSAHGTLLDGQRLRTNTLMKLERGAQLRFGGSTRLFVYHEPG